MFRKRFVSGAYFETKSPDIDSEKSRKLLMFLAQVDCQARSPTQNQKTELNRDKPTSPPSPRTQTPKRTNPTIQAERPKKHSELDTEHRRRSKFRIQVLLEIKDASAIKRDECIMTHPL